MFNSSAPIGLLDASAAVKLVLTEPGSDRLLAHFNPTGWFSITSFCLYEALGVLKCKLRKKVIEERDHYLKCCYMLITYVNQHRLRLEDPKLEAFETLRRAGALASQYSLDLSDALQLVTLQYDRLSYFVRESQPVLITADGDLAKAARAEGLRVWNCETEAQPPVQWD